MPVSFFYFQSYAKFFSYVKRVNVMDGQVYLLVPLPQTLRGNMSIEDKKNHSGEFVQLFRQPKGFEFDSYIKRGCITSGDKLMPQEYN